MTRLTRNVLANALGQSIVLIVSFASVKLVYVKLGADALGLLYFTLTLATIAVGLLEVGVATTLIRDVASGHEREPDYVQELLRMGGILYLIAYALVAIALFFLAPIIVGKWIQLTTLQPADAVLFLRVLSIAAMLGLLRLFYASALRGLERMGTTNAIDVVIAIVQQAGVFTILSFGGDLLGIALWLAITFVAATVLYASFVARAFGLRVLVPRFSRRVAARNWDAWRQTTSISALSAVHSQSDKLALAKLLPVSALGPYTVAYGVASRVGYLTDAVATAGYPSMSSARGADDHATFLARYWKLHDLVLIVTLPLFALVAFAAFPVYAFLFDVDVASSLVLPTALLAVGFYMHTTITLPHYAALSTGRPDIPARQNSWALVFVLPATIALVYAYGTVGAALSWIAYHLFMWAFAIPRIARECLRMEAKEWFSHAGRILILGGATFGLVWAVTFGMHVHAAGPLAIAYIVAACAYSILAMRIVRPELKATMIRWLSRGIRALEDLTVLENAILAASIGSLVLVLAIVDPVAAAVAGPFLLGFVVVKTVAGQALAFWRLELQGFFLAVYLLLLAVPAIFTYQTIDGPAKYPYMICIEAGLVTFPLGVLAVRAARPLNRRPIVASSLLVPGAFWAVLATGIISVVTYVALTPTVQLIEIIRGNPHDIDPIALRFAGYDSPLIVQFSFEVSRRLLLPLACTYSLVMWRWHGGIWTSIFWATFGFSVLASTLTLDRGPPFYLIAVLGLAFFLLPAANGERRVLPRALVLGAAVAVGLVVIGLISIFQYGSVPSFALALHNIRWVFWERIIKDPARMAALAFEAFNGETGFLHGRYVRLFTLPDLLTGQAALETGPPLTAAPVTFVADLWRNWGWPAAIAGPFVVGLAYAAIERRLARADAVGAAFRPFFLVACIWIIPGNAFGIVTLGVILGGIALLAAARSRALQRTATVEGGSPGTETLPAAEPRR